MGVDLLRTTMASLLAESEHPYADVRPLASALTRTSQVYFVTVTGTTASLDVDVPGDPLSVQVTNTNNGCVGSKDYGMAGAFANKFKASDDSQAYADAMITLGTGKFTIGTDADLNTAHDLICKVTI